MKLTLQGPYGFVLGTLQDKKAKSQRQHLPEKFLVASMVVRMAP